MKYLITFIIAVLLFSCTKKNNPEISRSDFEEYISYLASDSLKGRKAGSSEELMSAQYIRQKFEDAGLQLLFGNGFQPFNIVTEVELGEGNSFSVGGEGFVAGSDFCPYSFSANASFEGEVVFAGYGFNFKEKEISWNDYNNIDVSGKWVLVLKGDPELEKPGSIFARYSDERAKALNASDFNAGGILLVSGPLFSGEDKLSPMFFDKNSSSYTIPVIQVTRQLANKILAGAGKTVAQLEKELNDTRKPLGFSLDVKVASTVAILQKQVESINVAAVLPGTDPVLKDEYVIVGAHHDHLGMGGQGSGSRALDTIAVHNGADDNASGVAAVIELAQKTANEGNNKRSVIFTTFGAEEMGLIGSRAFTNNPPVDLSKVSAMFNFDMVGRLDTVTNSLSIGGTKTAVEIEGLLEKYNPGFNLALSGEGTGPSDHSSFYLQGIPVFFISTGAHSDYHTPDDDVELINFEGAEKVVSYAWEILNNVANRDSALNYREAGTIQRPGRGARFKVTLGIMPDFAGVEKRGLRVDAVSKGKPAFYGGMKKGDIITAVNGKKVGNIYDYMNRLNTLEAGQTITVDVLRDDKTLVLLVQL